MTAPINKFRRSWRVIERINNVYMFLKTSGAYGYANRCAQMNSKMLEDTILRQKQKSMGETFFQIILTDKNLPSQLRSMVTSLHQTTSSLVGSDGHRKLPQRGKVAYTQCYGLAFGFVTRNIADTKQPPLLIV